MKLKSRSKDQQAKKRLPLFTYLTYLLVATIVFTGVTFSGYISTSSGSDEACVAFVTAVASGTPLSVNNVIDPASNTPFEYKVTVSNAKDGKVSEVTLAYTIFIDLPPNFPPMDITVSDAVKDVVNSTETSLVFKSSKQLSVDPALGSGGSTNEHIISFAGTNETVGAYSDLPVSIRVIAEQVD